VRESPAASPTAARPAPAAVAAARPSAASSATASATRPAAEPTAAPETAALASRGAEAPVQDAAPPAPAPAAARPAPVEAAIAAAPATETQVDSPPPPEQLASLAPRYPARARRQRIEGWVAVRFRVQPDGSVADVSVVAAEPEGIFDREAVGAVSRWRFAQSDAEHWLERRIDFLLSR
jgi:protein TonB